VFTAASLRWLERVDAPIYTRPPVTYSEEWIGSYLPNHTFYLSAPRREKLHLCGKRPGIHGRAGTYIQRIFNRLLIDLSYNSARLEGNTYTLADTEQLLLRGVSATGKPNSERIMILNHREAIRYLVRNATNIEATEETVRTLHYLLADGLVAPGMAGHIRDESIAVSGATYAPLEGKERLTRLLVALLAKARQIEDPFEQSFFLLGHIAYLQAFVDVNKRTARLASIIPLIAHDYVPQSFIDVNKDDYIKATICFYEFNETGPLVDLYYWSYLRACQHYDTSVQVLGFDEIAALYRSQRRALVAEMLRAMIGPAEAAGYLAAHVPVDVEPQYREKFLADTLAEIQHLDISRIAGMGISRQQLEAWQKLR
jgi:hypothetical protein